MDDKLNQIKTNIFDPCALEISSFMLETESKEYDACRFKLSGRKIIYRNAKITPKKVGQFVTFWKRSENGPIEPYSASDLFDFYVVTAQKEKELGQFVFPKNILMKKGIISTPEKEGKRAFRVYPKWDNTRNEQAQRTQAWQLDYFYEINPSTDFQKILKLYKI
jgi:hypothetical protein